MLRRLYCYRSTNPHGLKLASLDPRNCYPLNILCDVHTAQAAVQRKSSTGSSKVFEAFCCVCFIILTFWLGTTSRLALGVASRVASRVASKLASRLASKTILLPTGLDTHRVYRSSSGTTRAVDQSTCTYFDIMLCLGIYKLL